MGRYDDQLEERPPSNAANQTGSAGSAGVPVAEGRAEDFFSQGESKTQESPDVESRRIDCLIFILSALKMTR